MIRLSFLKKIITSLSVFTIIILFVTLHDGIMSYMAPVILNTYLKDAFVVGLVLSTSSLFGMFLNFYIAEKLSNKRFEFFIKWMLVFAAIFTCMFLFLPRNIVILIMAMVVWSIYYEFRNYSMFDFVYHFLPSQKYIKAWSLFQVAKSTGYMVGPAIAMGLLTYGLNVPLYISLLFTGIASLVAIFFINKFSKKKLDVSNENQINRTPLKELRIIEILSRKIWPLVLFTFAISLLDASIWSIGILFAEKLREMHSSGHLFIVLYSLPQIFVGLVTPYIYKRVGKKRTAFITGILAGGAFVFFGMNSNIFVILGSILVAATFYGMTVILLSSIFEDYVTRMQTVSNDIISINQFAVNLAYAVGPMSLGFIAKYYSFETAFIIVGFVIILTATLAALIVPRKVRLPQKEIATELAAE